MNKLFALMAILSVSMPAMAVTSVGRGRASMANQMSSRVATIKTDANGVTVVTNTEEILETTDTQQTDTQKEDAIVKDMRERERAACIQNNIGVGATFVWASKYSNTENYNSMIEDTEFPENNVCFVKVALKSVDSRIDVSDIPTKYVVMGDNVTCGSWVNSDNLKQRILDAKKKGRTWATIGGAVGGAGIGVGAMELFGNKLLSNAGVESVEGQAALEIHELQCAHIKSLEDSDKKKVKGYLEQLKTNCDGTEIAGCKDFDYTYLLNECFEDEQ